MTTTLTKEQILSIKEGRKARWSHGSAFLDYIEGVARRSTGDNAALRRCILDRELILPEAYALVAPWAVSSGNRWLEELHYTIAGLYASYGTDRPSLLDGSDFGAFCRESAYRLRIDSGGLDTRFNVMMSGNRDELVRHLIEIFALLRTSGVGVDWFTLLQDLRFWSDRVKLRWARSYWGRPRRTENAEANAGGEIQDEN